MTIDKIFQNEKLVVNVAGRLDTTTAPELEASLNESMDVANELVLKLDNLEYISSAGLRVLLAAQKVMNKKQGMKVTGVNEVIMEIFEVTGFSDILTIVEESDEAMEDFVNQALEASAENADPVE